MNNVMLIIFFINLKSEYLYNECRNRVQSNELYVKWYKLKYITVLSGGIRLNFPKRIPRNDWTSGIGKFNLLRQFGSFQSRDAQPASRPLSLISQKLITPRAPRREKEQL